MKTLLKNAKVVDAHSAHNGKTVDLLIENGIISRIGNNLTASDAQTIDLGGACIAPGFVDLHSSLCDPGFEYKETLESGAAAALKGGFTHLLVMPDSAPAVSGKTQVEYILNKGKHLPVNMLVCGSLSHQLKGEDLAEMYDMQQSGAVAFFDVNRYVKAGLMSRALLYAKNFGGKIFSAPFDPSLAPGGMMHEGVVATTLGMKGIPEIAEEIVIRRDLALAEYNETGLHFAGISSPLSVSLINEARKKGMQMSCHIPAYLLSFTDEDLREFDTHLKVQPPVRPEKTRKELIALIKNGSIDAIASCHSPEDPESKTVEFDHAENGMIGLETAFAAAHTALHKEMKAEDIVKLFGEGPRRILGMPALHITEGAEASLTCFDAEIEWTFSKNDVASRSKNTPYIGKQLKGKIRGVFCKNQYHAN